MAYDRELANRIRELVSTERGIEEKAMFGGLAFLVGGNMAVAASGQGGIMVRSDPEETSLLEAPGTSLMEMRGREMKGWIRVTAEAVDDDQILAQWITVGVEYAKTLPPK